MKLGTVMVPGSFVADNFAGVARPAPAAWSRIVGTPRVEGDNSVIGDCVETAGFNCVQTAFARKGVMNPLPNAAVPGIYSAITGWNAAIPSSDRGTDPEAFFNWWKLNQIGGHTLADLSRIDPRNKTKIRECIAHDGGVFLIVALATENQNERIWTASGTPGSWGNHCVWADGYEGDLTISTSWGEEQPVDGSYFDKGFVIAVYTAQLSAPML